MSHSRIASNSITFHSELVFSFKKVNTNLEIRFGSGYSAVIMSTSKIHDSFCWKCHKDEAELKCSDCILSFHSNCVSNMRQETANRQNWICAVCIQINEAANTDKKTELKLLVDIIDYARTEKRFKEVDKLYLQSKKSALVVKPFDWSVLKTKAERTYTSFVEFLTDAEWIVHNSFICYPDNRKKRNDAVTLLEHFKEEVEDVKKCAECYSKFNTHPKTWFTFVCDKPHLIVWAKLNGFAYFPAKVMSIVDRLLINVRFFGEHSYADVLASNCRLFCTPDTIYTFNREPSDSEIMPALKEAKLYIANICEKFGSFEYYDKEIPFDPALLEAYIDHMISKPEHSKNMSGQTQSGFGYQDNDNDDNDVILIEPDCKPDLTTAIIPIVGSERCGKFAPNIKFEIGYLSSQPPLSKRPRVIDNVPRDVHTPVLDENDLTNDVIIIEPDEGTYLCVLDKVPTPPASNNGRPQKRSTNIKHEPFDSDETSPMSNRFRNSYGKSQHDISAPILDAIYDEHAKLRAIVTNKMSEKIDAMKREYERQIDVKDHEISEMQKKHESQIDELKSKIKDMQSAQEEMKKKILLDLLA